MNTQQTDARAELIAYYSEQYRKFGDNRDKQTAAMLAADKPDPQAQAAEPEVVAWPDAPQTIYLQVCEDDECGDRFQDHADVTWCADKINSRDIKYVRAESIAKKDAALMMCVEALNALLPDPKDSNHDGYDARDVRTWRAAITKAQEALK